MHRQFFTNTHAIDHGVNAETLIWYNMSACDAQARVIRTLVEQGIVAAIQDFIIRNRKADKHVSLVHKAVQMLKVLSSNHSELVRRRISISLSGNEIQDKILLSINFPPPRTDKHLKIKLYMLQPFGTILGPLARKFKKAVVLSFDGDKVQNVWTPQYLADNYGFEEGDLIDATYT